VPEFEVRLFWASQKTYEAILIDAKSEKAALPLAAGLAQTHGADFFELRRPISQRWVRRN
jgi:hypothetical protein